MMKEKEIIRRLSSVGIAGNIALASFKLYAGIAGHSSAMISDAVHSASDIFATLIAWIGTLMARQAPDEKHPYGHDRFECLASLLLGIILFATGGSIGLSAIRTIAAGHYDSIVRPEGIALAAAVISIAVKEGMFHYTRFYAKKLNSAAFLADAWHHRSDALSSIGSMAGIGGAMLGFPVLEPIASVGICICILKVAFDILKDAVNKLLDTSCSEEYEKKLRSFITSQPGVIQIDLLRTREFGNAYYVDAEISMDGQMTLWDAHAIAENVHDAVEKNFPEVRHIMIRQLPHP